MRGLPRRIVVLIVVSAVVVVVVAAYAAIAYRQHQRDLANAPEVASTDLDTVLAGPHVVFRSTLPGNEYGLVAAVPLDDTTGARAFTDVACDRVDVAGEYASCLRTLRGIATKFETQILDSAWQPVRTWPLPGIPSRTRLSDDGTLVGTTAFVTGHSYASIGFSTQTDVHGTDGTRHGNIEEWALTVDGEAFTAADRNLWGVTFVDDNRFYATAASPAAGKTWLVEGSISGRSMESLQENAECPSISPDRTKVAYKKVVDRVNTQSVWAVAVRDIASGTETLIESTTGLDDQVEWLDDDTLLYGLPREDEPGTTDVFSVDTRADARPALFIPGAWSPSVVP